MPCITLTTDFGLRDWFVGTMKGVILARAPKTSVIDLTHDIPPGDIRAGAFAIASSYSYFPPGTIHVVVVDPGVGSQRQAIAVKTSRYVFVGPDNGVLSMALARENVQAIHALEAKRYFLAEVSSTFHGRDIFAPVAAQLSRGLSIPKLGPALKGYVQIDWPEPKQKGREIHGQVVYIDHFGNAITNIESRLLQNLKGRGVRLKTRRRAIPIAAFYQVVNPGDPVAVCGSTGFLEIAINGGNAARDLGLNAGSKIEIC